MKILMYAVLSKLELSHVFSSNYTPYLGTFI